MVTRIGDDALEEPARGLRRAQLVAACDVYVWKLLRHDLHLGVPDTEAAMTGIVEGIVAGVAPGMR